VDELIERIHDKYKLPDAQVYRVYGGNRNLSILRALVGRIRRLRRIRHKNRLSLSERGESPSDYRV
ncbi:hypothetical protein ACPW07_30245, partial [Klebsiella pneumoniae]|uniref:hypothetical protein n=1 Tax=Klebsiella pneumoniae TaxID=573 RepID=UPI003CE6F539